MKKTVSIMAAVMLLLILCMTSVVSVSAGAEHKFLGAFTYTIIGGEATVIDVRDDVTPQVAIPAMLENCPVTGIEEKAFQECNNIVSIEIPLGVRLIGAGAFEECTALKEIIVDEKNATYSAKEGVLYNKDQTTLVCYPASKGTTSFVIPSTVTSIDPSAFYGASKLTGVTIPNSVTSIGKRAFMQCKALKNVKIGDGVVSIGEQAFSECASLEQIVIPDNVTSADKFAFEKCVKLTDVTIGKGITEISSQMFLGCTALKSITIPHGVKNIRTGAFAKCTALEQVLMGNTVVQVDARAFYGCTNLKEVLYEGGEEGKNTVLPAGNEAFINAAWQYHARIDGGKGFVWWWLAVAGAVVVIAGVVVVLIVRGAKAKK